jgi:hypothetical protein
MVRAAFRASSSSFTGQEFFRRIGDKGTHPILDLRIAITATIFLAALLLLLLLLLLFGSRDELGETVYLELDWEAGLKVDHHAVAEDLRGDAEALGGKGGDGGAEAGGESAMEVLLLRDTSVSCGTQQRWAGLSSGTGGTGINTAEHVHKKFM